ncbi:hypothetical protein M7I_4074 [Glarea lozoyensis 74030]|uniref:Uncharacterized protein n=1 Tax=Glarea lozoyensis (strain ATCC 74030 / MF5533) TaxID=1104152 RepID=H0EN71_GLAL7|nr:hypothetical protein M7I_4074 [Glarea lozoyensis 74030]
MREVVEEEKRRDEAENRQRSEENLKHFQQPSTYFGYIAGTSTRGVAVAVKDNGDAVTTYLFRSDRMLSQYWNREV